MSKTPKTFSYERWRHGGWYVPDVRYPSGAIGCVSRNYDDRRWRIVCDPRGFGPSGPTFKARTAAAQAEYELAQAEFKALSAEDVERRIAAMQTKFPGGRADEYCNWLRRAHADALAA